MKQKGVLGAGRAEARGVPEFHTGWPLKILEEPGS